MIEFDTIPFEFISDSLTDYQKKSIIIKYEIVNTVKSKKGKESKNKVFYDLSVKLNVEFQTVRNIYYSLKK